jgi:hypothetical protein
MKRIEQHWRDGRDCRTAAFRAQLKLEGAIEEPPTVECRNGFGRGSP